MTGPVKPDPRELAALIDLLGDEAEAMALFEAMAEATVPVAPPASLRDRVMAGAVSAGRFDRFTDAVARVLQVGAEQARGLLARIQQASEWRPDPTGLGQAIWVDGGPALAGAISGFVRFGAGLSFPEHTHLGDEIVLVLQGSFVDHFDGSVVRAGEEVHRPAGSTHGYTVRPGPDLLYLTVLDKGLEVGGVVIGPDDRPE